KNIRSATLMLVFVTCTYLGSNLLNVIVYTWELIDKESLMTDELRPFYTLSSDLVSLLTVLARNVPFTYVTPPSPKNPNQIVEPTFFHPINKKGETRVRSIGTGLDRIVLSVAMGSMGAMGNSVYMVSAMH
ncbi:hypothetical protein ANCCEY_14964, partial [Ancylostoma ceylanicum]